MKRPSRPDGANAPRGDQAPDGSGPSAPEPTSQPDLTRRQLELPDGRYLLAYERTRKPDA
jgi:hypothetical protein